MVIQIKQLQTIDAGVLKQVDRSENVKVMYAARPSSTGLGLELQPLKQDPAIAIPHWDDEGISIRLSIWQPQIEAGGTVLAALQEEKIVGFGIIGPKHQDGSVELCALFVSSEPRRSGVGLILFQRLEALAVKQDAESLLIYSNPTGSSVDFYRKQNCQIIGIADKRLVSHLPWDIVFAKPLAIIGPKELLET
jgi:hypothetical protein